MYLSNKKYTKKLLSNFKQNIREISGNKSHKGGMFSLIRSCRISVPCDHKYKKRGKTSS